MKKVAIIGAGNIFETVHYPQFSKLCEIVAVADTVESRAKAVSEKYGIPKYFTSDSEMYRYVRPDIVCVCTPNKFHYDAVMLALQNGCNVLCEKPPAVNSAQSREMMALAEEKNLVLAYNLHYRHSRNVEILKKEIDGGRLGDIYNVKVTALRRRGVPGWGTFINKDMQGGGPLIDLGIHMLDAALYLMGYPKAKSVTASSYDYIGAKKSKGTLGNWDPCKFQVEDSLFAFVKFENGATLMLETSFALNIKEKSRMNVQLMGTEAGASVFPLEIYEDIDGELTDIAFPFLEENGGYSNSIIRFVERCEGRDAMLATGAQGHLLQELIDKIYQSAESGDLVVFD